MSSDKKIPEKTARSAAGSVKYYGFGSFWAEIQVKP